jgi:hypothetical protein
MATRIERRKARSRFPGEAANLYLGAVARRYGLRAAVLADEQGLPIAATGPKIAEDALSAYGAFRSASGESNPSAPSGPRSISLQLGGHSVSLTVLGSGQIPWSLVTGDLSRILDLRG